MRFLRWLAVLASLSVCMFASESPFNGTWKFNPSKGQLTPPIPKSDVAHIQADDETFKFSDETVDADGKETKSSYEAKFDGRDYPIVGDPDHGTVSLQRVSDHEIKVTVKKGNKVDSELDVVISKHGRTATSKYTDYSQGKPQKGIAIYEKQ